MREQLRCAVLKGQEREQALSDLNEELLQHSCCSIKSLLKELHKGLLQKTKTGSMPEDLYVFQRKWFASNKEIYQ